MIFQREGEPGEHIEGVKDNAEDFSGGKTSHSCWSRDKAISDPFAESNIGGKFSDSKA